MTDGLHNDLHNDLHKERQALADMYEALASQRDAAHARADAFTHAAEMLWVVLANVNGGNWAAQTADWQTAAAKWRDYYFSVRDSQ